MKSFSYTAILLLTRLSNIVPTVLGLASSSSDLCATDSETGAWLIDADCIDPTYETPVIESESDETDPVPHHKVVGYFNNTETRFQVYLPASSSWDGRFFQLVYPSQSEQASSRAIAFGADSGAYTVQSSGSIGYRSAAAAARLSKDIARKYYESGERQIYGYVYGGSGGSLITIGAMENTRSVWDGSVTLIQAIPLSPPIHWCFRALASFVLEQKFSQIIDAIRPGGSGDPRATLSGAERSIFDEVSALGIQYGTWEDIDGLAGDSFSLWTALRTFAIPSIRDEDPTFVDDFWNKSGYLGTETSELGDIFRASLISFEATVQSIGTNGDGVPETLTLNQVPRGIDGTRGLELSVPRLGTQEAQVFTGRLDAETSTIFIHPDQNTTILRQIVNVGAKLQVDNRWHLAALTYHRHQVPAQEDGYYAYDYFRDEQGVPVYPQRKSLLAPPISQSASGGGIHSGKINGKVIVMDNLLDYDAFPWQADWYRQRVEQALGAAGILDNFRLYYSDHADHDMGHSRRDQHYRTVPFESMWEQHLRDLAAWTENGQEPPTPTRFLSERGQIIVPDSAGERAGIQPVANLTIGCAGSQIFEARVGKTLSFKLQAEMPPGTGDIVSIEWDPFGTGNFTDQPLNSTHATIISRLEHKYDLEGTFFPVARVAGHRNGDVRSPFTQIMTLARARVIVKSD